MTTVDQACFEAAVLISQADGLVITAGAGMGIDSGLPDFRGDNGFWKAYPALGKLGMQFSEVASPAAFESIPEIAWGFYGHRLQLYRETIPHQGFRRLLDLANQMPNGAFVFTSNVDGQFQKAGFGSGRIVECHGSIHHLQCSGRCGEPVWSAGGFIPEIDIVNCKLLSELPVCPGCGGMARPNILMFGDWHWDEMRTDMQSARMNAWQARAKRPVVIELGAGTAIPTVRRFGEESACPMIRINPTESKVGLRRDISIPIGAMDGIKRITEFLENM
jgi:NAD-dependent SIR2 family protein deacetylase